MYSYVIGVDKVIFSSTAFFLLKKNLLPFTPFILFFVFTESKNWRFDRIRVSLEFFFHSCDFDN